MSLNATKAQSPKLTTLAALVCSILCVLVAGVAGASTPTVTPFPAGDTPPTLNAFTCSSPNDYVQTTSGPVCGGHPKAHPSLLAYWGIPYAESTAGDNRWKAPKPIAPADRKHHKADTFGPWCPQVKGILSKQYVGSEDCLSLNIWTPSLKPNKPLPVMVYIHGGAFIQGASWVPTALGDSLYDGGSLSQSQQVVVVSLNYRLGAMGFLGGQHGYSGNAGFQDQQLALQWVQQNIANFGGDHSNVTIFGESAGAMSVGLHMLSAPSSYEEMTILVRGEPVTIELFNAGIMQSNPVGLPYKDSDEAGSNFTAYQDEVCKVLKVKSKDCKLETLQKAKLGDLLKAQSKLSIDNPAGDLQNFLTWTPVIDGEIIRNQPLDGTFNKGAVIGTNQNEGILFAYGLWVAASYTNPTCAWGSGKACFKHIVGQLLPDYVQQVETLYPPGDNRFTAVQQLARMFTDYTFTCANQVLGGRAASDLYAYRFLQTSNPGHFYINDAPSGCAGAKHAGKALYCECWSDKDKHFKGTEDAVCHGAEVPYVFNSPGFSAHAFDGDQKALSSNMQSMWGDFAKDPYSAPTKTWAPFATAKQSLALAGAGPYSMADVPTSANCGFWIDTVGFKPGTMSAFQAALTFAE